jgi:geranylgeranyl diphosphate synthase type II
VKGSRYDMNFEIRNDVKHDEYIHMISLKTSVLLAAALQIGAKIRRASDEDAQYLYDFGKNIGIASSNSKTISLIVLEKKIR